MLKVIDEIDIDHYQKENLAVFKAKNVHETYLYTDANIEYEKIYHNCEIINESLVAVDGNSVLGFIAIYPKDKKISFFGRPISVFLDKNLSSEQRFEIYQLFIFELEKKLERPATDELIFFNDDYFVSSLQKYHLEASVGLYSVVDLSLSKETIKRSVRKSYRSLISWGIREMQIILIDKNNPDSEKFEDFRLFHIEVSQKETRPKSSWDVQFEMIRNGEAYLYLGYLGGSLVSGALSFIGNKEAFYGVAVNNRNLMYEKKGIGHAIIFQSIIKAQELGLEFYNLGQTGLYFGSKKEEEIAKFKKGFSSTSRSKVIFNVKKITPTS